MFVVQSPSWVQLLLHLPWLYKGFPCGSADKESACNAGHLGSIPGLERSLEKGKATHFSILPWRTPWTSSWGCKELDTTEWLSLSFHGYVKICINSNMMETLCASILVCLHLKIIRKRWVLSWARWHQSQSSRPLRAKAEGKMLGPLQRGIQEYVQPMCFCLEPILTLSVIRTSS